MGPRVYIIPQNQGEAPLEVRSIAPGQRKGRKGVIAEIPGRNIKRSRRMLDIPNQVSSDLVSRPAVNGSPLIPGLRC